MKKARESVLFSVKSTLWAGKILLCVENNVVLQKQKCEIRLRCVKSLRRRGDYNLHSVADLPRKKPDKSGFLLFREQLFVVQRHR